MNKRLGALFVLPLLLGVLLGGIKWKQLHPTPTQFDLQERAHLIKARRVELRLNGAKLLCPLMNLKKH